MIRKVTIVTVLGWIAATMMAAVAGDVSVENFTVDPAAANLWDPVTIEVDVVNTSNNKTHTYTVAPRFEPVTFYNGGQNWCGEGFSPPGAASCSHMLYPICGEQVTLAPGERRHFAWTWPAGILGGYEDDGPCQELAGLVPDPEDGQVIHVSAWERKKNGTIIDRDHDEHPFVLVVP